MHTKTLANQAWSLSIALLAAYAVMFIPFDALATGAAGGGPASIERALCTVVGWFTGKVGSAVATLAIIIIGVGALMGKVSWGMAIIVGLGVAVIFGSQQIAGLLGATGGC